MVTIITGERNSGKTTFFEYWYSEVRRGTGFCLKKLYEGNEFQGYDLVLLPDKERLPFMTVVHPQQEYGNSRIMTEKLAVDTSVFPFVDKWMQESIQNPDEPVWIDEVGMTELSGGGFDTLLRRVLKECSDVRLVIRKNILYKLVQHYGIEKFSLVYV